MPAGKKAYRPYLILILDRSTLRIRQYLLRNTPPSPDLVYEVVQEAIKNPMPGSGKPISPSQILFDDPTLVKQLSQWLASDGIRCQFQRTPPAMQKILYRIESNLTGREPIPGLLSRPGVTLPLVQEFFAVATQFYQSAPWRWLSNRSPIAATYRAAGGAEQTRYAVILGTGSEFFGLSVYDSLADLQALYDDSGHRQPKRVPSLSMIYEDAQSMSFEDLDLVEKYQLPVAEEWAYPVPVKEDEAGLFHVPSASELLWLSALLQVLPNFIFQGLPTDPAESVEQHFELSNVHGQQNITLHYVAKLLD
jgi:hypothetical protein